MYLSVQVLEPGQEGGTVPGLRVTQALGVLELGGQGDLGLTESGNGVLSLINLPGEILVLDLELLLGRVSLVQGPCELIQLLVGLNNQTLGELSVPLVVGPVPHGLIKASSGLLEVALHASLVLLRLGLHLVEGVDLLTHLRHVVVVLLPEGGQGALMGNVGLLQLGLELGKLSLPLLVELNLGGGVVASILKLLSEVLNVPGEGGPVLLGLGAVLALNGQLLIKLLETRLQFLEDIRGAKFNFLIYILTSTRNILP